jgi:hypothetical protein
MSENKIVVFDLDETLGYFSQLYIFWESLNINEKHDVLVFNQLVDLFPEYIRPNIETILKYLKDKKEDKKCKHVMIYTNNQRDKTWVYMIKKYFETKIGCELFDKIICAFKINGKRVELERTTHEKTHCDFIKCSKLPENTQICFIDDTYFPKMHADEVYYIKIKPYVYCLSAETMLKRCKQSQAFVDLLSIDLLSIDFEDTIKKNIGNYKKKSMKEYEIDKIITKQIMNHIESFFQNKLEVPLPLHQNKNKNKTKKNKKSHKNKTLRG